ncbi:unnamed protein product [Arctogadus glacialis]
MIKHNHSPHSTILLSDFSSPPHHLCRQFSFSSKPCVRMGESLLRAAHILPSSWFFIDHNLGVESHVRHFQPRFVRTQRLSMRPLDCFRGNGRLRELRGWDPDCFRGYGEPGELRGWDPDCFRGNGGHGGQAEACSGEDEVEGGPLLEGLEVLE